MSGNDSSSGGNVTRVDPWKEQQPYLQGLYSGAQNLYNQNLMRPFEGSTVAGRSAPTTAGEQYTLDYAQHLMPQVAQQQREAWQQQLQAPNVESNPHLAGFTQAALRPIQQNYEENIRPNLQSRAIQAGAYGGANADLVNAQAARDHQNTIADTTSRIYMDAYNRGMSSQANAIGMAPAVTSTGLAPGQAISAVGAQQDADAQRRLDDSVRLWREQGNLPWQQLSNFSALIQGNPGSVTTAPSPTPSPVAGAAGGAITGATLAQMLSLSNPWTYALAGLGALGGGL